MSSSLTNLFTALASGTIKGKDALKTFATAILSNMEQIAAQALSKSIMNTLFGSLLSGGTGGTGGIGSIFKSLLGGAGSRGIGSATLHPSPIGPGMATGGIVTGGVENRDSVPRTLTPGEFVLKRSAVDVIGRDSLDRMNTMGASMVARSPAVERDRFANSALAAANVYVVPSDQVPPPDRNTVVHWINDTLEKNGSTAPLVKSITSQS